LPFFANASEVIEIATHWWHLIGGGTSKSVASTPSAVVCGSHPPQPSQV